MTIYSDTLYKMYNVMHKDWNFTLDVAIGACKETFKDLLKPKLIQNVLKYLTVCQSTAQQ